MKVKIKKINKALLIRGIFAKKFLKGTESSFNRLNKITRNKVGKDIKGLFCETIYIYASDGTKIRTRIYRKNNDLNNRLAVLYLHGGGFVMSSPENDHVMIKKLVLEFDLVVVAPDYRIGNEGVYPNALDDCFDTFTYMKNNFRSLRIRHNGFIVVGGSAGGGLATAVTLKARDLRLNYINLLVLLYPMLNYKSNTRSMIDNDAPIWDYKMNKLAWSIYLRDVKYIDKYASPSLENDYARLPETIVMIGSLDPFLDETVDFVDKMKQVNGNVKIRVFRGAYHAFEVACPHAKISKKANEYIFKNLRIYLEKVRYI